MGVVLQFARYFHIPYFVCPHSNPAIWLPGLSPHRTTDQVASVTAIPCLSVLEAGS